MGDWLTSSIRWQRQQAISDRTEAKRLLDDEWATWKARGHRLEASHLRSKAEVLEHEAAELDDRGYRERESSRLLEEADHWDRLAAEHEAYRERKADAPLFDSDATA